MNNDIGYEIKINDLCIMNSHKMICFIQTSVEKNMFSLARVFHFKYKPLYILIKLNIEISNKLNNAYILGERSISLLFEISYLHLEYNNHRRLYHVEPYRLWDCV